jgi:hypothetical protein
MARPDSRRNIVEYIKKNLKKGYTVDSLKWALVNQGYSRITIETAIQEVNKELAKSAPILKEKPVIKYEIIDEYDNPVEIKRSFWKRLFGV